MCSDRYRIHCDFSELIAAITPAIPKELQEEHDEAEAEHYDLLKREAELHEKIHNCKYPEERRKLEGQLSGVT